MTMQGERTLQARVRHHVRGNAVGYLALFVALGGTATAATYVVNSNADVAPGTISGHAPPAGDHSNIIAGSVNYGDLAAGAVTSSKIAANSVNGGKVFNDSLSGNDVNESTLGQVPSAQDASHAANSDQLGGLGPSA